MYLPEQAGQVAENVELQLAGERRGAQVAAWQLLIRLLHEGLLQSFLQGILQASRCTRKRLLTCSGGGPKSMCARVSMQQAGVA